MRKYSHNPTLEQRKQQTERWLLAISAANQAKAREFYDWKRANGLKVRSLDHIVGDLYRLDRFLGGQPYKATEPVRLTELIATMRDRYSPATIYGTAGRLKDLYKWLNDDQLPPLIRRALKVRAPRESMPEPLSDADFQALLKAAQDSPHCAVRVSHTALLWTLWESGFRIGELLAMRVGGVTRLGAESVQLALPEGVDGLKTGARRITVAGEGAKWILAWLDLHPEPSRAMAPLFPARHKAGREAYWPQNINQLLKTLALKAAVQRRVYPHLFRHTCATRKAKLGWVEAEMRIYFGWSRSSDMPTRYVNLNADDVEKRVLRDAGLLPTNAPMATVPPVQSDLDDAIEAALRRKFLGGAA